MKIQFFNRRVLFSLLAAVMCFGLTAVSYGAATVSVDPATMDSPAVGEQFTVNINIAGGAGVAGYQVDVGFDSSALKYVSGANSDYLPTGAFVVPVKVLEGNVVQLAATSLSGTSDGDGTLATVTFEVLEVKASSITLSGVIVADAAGTGLEVTTADGAITVATPGDTPSYGVMLEGVGELTGTTTDSVEGVTYMLKVTNTGDTEDTILLGSSAEVGIEGSVLGSFSKAGDEGPSTSQLEIELAPGATKDVMFTVSGDLLTQPGEYRIEVTATSSGDSTKYAKITTVTTIKAEMDDKNTGDTPSYGVMLEGVGELTGTTTDSVEGVTYMLKVTNTGDTEDTILLGSSAEVGIEGSVLGSFSKAGDEGPSTSQLEIELAPGATKDVMFTVSGDLLTQPGEYRIEVTATSSGDSTKYAKITTVTTITEIETIAPESQMFAVTLTNLTTGEPGMMGGQIFSPPIFATHSAGTKFFELGEPASEAMVLLAENGDTSALAALAASMNASTVQHDGFVVPGASVTVMVPGNIINSSLSFATMLVSTNDAFIGRTDVALYDEAGMPISVTIPLQAYDAGSEQNTERGSDIPGPIGLSPEEDPEGSNLRVPTVGGVITAHTGILGVGEVADSFAWTEPTATLTIEPYVPPELEPELVLPTYDVTLASGLNMISVPLMPVVPLKAKSLAKMLLDSTVVIKLDTHLQKFVGYVVSEDDDGFDIEGGKGYIVNTPKGGTVTFKGNAWSNAPAEEVAAAPALANAKNAWAFVVTSRLQDKVSGVSYTMVAKNLRTGVVTTQNVTSEDGHVTAVWADLSYKSVIQAGDKVEIALVDDQGTVVSGPFERRVQTTDIHNAFMSVEMRVGDVRPKETVLGQNFPNPFNPETWIPYQLNQDTIVKIQIYNVSGHLVRTLNLGHQSTGSYMNNATAAYWDGKNDAGEAVSSGIYFYSLKTANFTATRRMVILK